MADLARELAHVTVHSTEAWTAAIAHARDRGLAEEDIRRFATTGGSPRLLVVTADLAHQSVLHETATSGDPAFDRQRDEQDRGLNTPAGGHRG